MPYALAAHSSRIECRLLAGFAIGVGAGIDGVGEHVVDSGIARVDPTNPAALVHLQRKGELLRAEPEPDATRGACLAESCKNVADGSHDRLIRVKANLAIGLAPDEANRQATTQLAARSLVADASVKTSAQHMQFGLAHSALEPEQEPVVEQRRMIDAVGIADQRVGEAAQIDKAVPVSVVARET